MPLFYLLPLITFVIFLVSFLFFKKKDTNLFYLVFVSLTGLVFSVVEAFIIYKQYGFDNGVILDNLFYFVLLIILNSLNCIIKIKFFVDNRRFSDLFSIFGLVIFILKFIAK